MSIGSAPSGTVTFLFTDIEGSTWLIQHLGDAYDRVLHDHYSILRRVWAENDGFEVSTEGDAFFVAFANAADAVRAAIAAQRALADHVWPEDGIVRVRIGIHTGEARLYGSDYVGIAVHQAARIQSAAHGGQVLVSQATREEVSEGLEFLDLGPHRLKDLAHPVRIFQVCASDLPADFPPPRTLSVMPNNFPLQTTGFVGRDDDIAQVRQLLREGRLVTLTGAGGVGKTRLALQAGAELIDDFPDGAWLVDLAPLADPDVVAGTVADTLGIRAQAGRHISDTLADQLVAKGLLIVLDNCEHLIDACAKLVYSVLSSCPRVKVLATNRETLNVAGEVGYRLRSLDVPASSAGLDQAARAESVRLFTQRARAARPDFDLNPEIVGAVIQICHRLDGLPLAIELAAARMRAMSPQEIATRLDDRFRLLTGGSRMALPRQRTLEATVSWSYELLTKPERLLFDRLSVFAGGCSLDGAEHVCVDGQLDAFDVLDLLTHLVDRSLVVAEEDGTGRTRYRLLETLRQFGRDRLLAIGEVATMRDRHLAWVVEIAATLPPQTGTDPPPEVQAESDNLRAAIEWAIETDDYESALRILSDVWNFNVHFDVRARWFERVLPHADQGPPDIAARALAAAGGLAFMMGNWERSVAHHHAAGQAARAAGDDHILTLSLLYEGASMWGLGDEAKAQALVDEGLDVARSSSDDEMIRRGLIFAAWTEADRDSDKALDLASEADRLSRSDGNPFDRAHSREVLGYILAVRGDLPAAAATLAEALPLFEPVLIGCAAHVLETSAAWMAMSARLEVGAELWGAADRLRMETNDRPRPWERTVHDVWLPKISDHLDGATFEGARDRGFQMGRSEALVYAEGMLRRSATDGRPSPGNSA